jgi:hypothetical protein
VGLSRAEFWDLTPRHWERIWERYVDKQIREDRRFGQLAAVYANIHRDREEHPQPYTIENFAPALRGQKVEEQQPAVAQSPEMQMALMRAAEAISVATGKAKGTGAWGKLSDEEYAALFPDRPLRSTVH